MHEPSLMCKDVLEYVMSRGFTVETIKKYRLGAGIETFIGEAGLPVDVKVIYFPMCITTKKNSDLWPSISTEDKKLLTCKLTKVKIRGASADTKMFMRQNPSGPYSGFFGLHTVG